MRYIIFIFSLALLVVSVAPADALQDGEGTPPPEIEIAMEALEARLGEPISFETLAAFQWEARNFSDAGLGCPQPGQMYTQVVTPGYQFLLTYSGTTYDYRVAEGGESSVLCDSFPAQSVETPSPADPENAESPCGAFYEVQDDDILLDIAEQCETSVDVLVSVNPDVTDPDLIYPGQRLAIPSTTSPYNVSIAPDSGPPGTTIALTASGFPPGTRVEYGLGRFNSEYDVYGTREVGDTGTLTTTVTIPEGADFGEEWVGVVVVNGVESISEIFEVTETSLFTQTQIYLVAPGDAGRSGMEIGCADSIVPVTISIEPTVAPLSAAIERMLAIDSRTYGQSGLYNAFYLSNLTLDGIDIEDREATIALSGTINIGGVCDVPRIEQQLRQTALQYDTIDAVSIEVNSMPLLEVLR